MKYLQWKNKVLAINLYNGILDNNENELAKTTYINMDKFQECIEKKVGCKGRHMVYVANIASYFPYIKIYLFFIFSF